MDRCRRHPRTPATDRILDLLQAGKPEPWTFSTDALAAARVALEGFVRAGSGREACMEAVHLAAFLDVVKRCPTAGKQLATLVNDVVLKNNIAPLDVAGAAESATDRAARYARFTDGAPRATEQAKPATQDDADAMAASVEAQLAALVRGS